LDKPILKFGEDKWVLTYNNCCMKWL
jgi:hypothetical protein